MTAIPEEDYQGIKSMNRKCKLCGKEYKTFRGAKVCPRCFLTKMTEEILSHCQKFEWDDGTICYPDCAEELRAKLRRFIRKGFPCEK